MIYLLYAVRGGNYLKLAQSAYQSHPLCSTWRPQPCWSLSPSKLPSWVQSCNMNPVRDNGPGDFRGTFPFPVQFFVSKNMSESPDCVILGSSGEDEEPQLEQHQGRNNPPRFTQYDVESIPPSRNQGGGDSQPHAPSGGHHMLSHSPSAFQPSPFFNPMANFTPASWSNWNVPPTYYPPSSLLSPQGFETLSPFGYTPSAPPGFFPALPPPGPSSVPFPYPPYAGPVPGSHPSPWPRPFVLWSCPFALSLAAPFSSPLALPFAWLCPLALSLRLPL